MSGVGCISTKISTKAQVWYADFVFAVSIFIVSVIFYFIVTSNLSNSGSDIQANLLKEAEIASNALKSPGFPLNWDNETVVRPGLSNDQVEISSSKVIAAANISYSAMKTLLGISYDFHLFFTDTKGNPVYINGTCGLGYPGIAQCGNLSQVKYSNLVKLERLMIYQTNPVKMVVYTWQ